MKRFKNALAMLLAVALMISSLPAQQVFASPAPKVYNLSELPKMRNDQEDYSAYDGVCGVSYDELFKHPVYCDDNGVFNIDYDGDSAKSLVNYGVKTPNGSSFYGDCFNNFNVKDKLSAGETQFDLVITGDGVKTTGSAIFSFKINDERKDLSTLEPSDAYEVGGYVFRYTVSCHDGDALIQNKNADGTYHVLFDVENPDFKPDKVGFMTYCYPVGNAEDMQILKKGRIVIESGETKSITLKPEDFGEYANFFKNEKEITFKYTDDRIDISDWKLAYYSEKNLGPEERRNVYYANGNYYCICIDTVRDENDIVYVEEQGKETTIYVNELFKSDYYICIWNPETNKWDDFFEQSMTAEEKRDEIVLFEIPMNEMESEIHSGYRIPDLKGILKYRAIQVGRFIDLNSMKYSKYPKNLTKADDDIMCSTYVGYYYPQEYYFRIAAYAKDSDATLTIEEKDDKDYITVNSENDETVVIAAQKLNIKTNKWETINSKEFDLSYNGGKKTDSTTFDNKFFGEDYVLLFGTKTVEITLKADHSDLSKWKLSDPSEKRKKLDQIETAYEVDGKYFMLVPEGPDFSKFDFAHYDGDGYVTVYSAEDGLSIRILTLIWNDSYNRWDHLGASDPCRLELAGGPCKTGIIEVNNELFGEYKDAFKDNQLFKFNIAEGKFSLGEVKFSKYPTDNATFHDDDNVYKVYDKYFRIVVYSEEADIPISIDGKNNLITVTSIKDEEIKIVTQVWRADGWQVLKSTSETAELNSQAFPISITDDYFDRYKSYFKGNMVISVKGVLGTEPIDISELELTDESELAKTPDLIETACKVGGKYFVIVPETKENSVVEAVDKDGDGYLTVSSSYHISEVLIHSYIWDNSSKEWLSLANSYTCTLDWVDDSMKTETICVSNELFAKYKNAFKNSQYYNFKIVEGFCKLNSVAFSKYPTDNATFHDDDNVYKVLNKYFRIVAHTEGTGTQISVDELRSEVSLTSDQNEKAVFEGQIWDGTKWVILGTQSVDMTLEDPIKEYIISPYMFGRDYYTYFSGRKNISIKLKPETEPFDISELKLTDKSELKKTPDRIETACKVGGKYFIVVPTDIENSVIETVDKDGDGYLTVRTESNCHDANIVLAVYIWDDSDKCWECIRATGSYKLDLEDDSLKKCTICLDNELFGEYRNRFKNNQYFNFEIVDGNRHDISEWEYNQKQVYTDDKYLIVVKTTNDLNNATTVKDGKLSAYKKYYFCIENAGLNDTWALGKMVACKEFVPIQSGEYTIELTEDDYGKNTDELTGKFCMTFDVVDNRPPVMEVIIGKKEAVLPINGENVTFKCVGITTDFIVVNNAYYVNKDGKAQLTCNFEVTKENGQTEPKSITLLKFENGEFVCPDNAVLNIEVRSDGNNYWPIMTAKTEYQEYLGVGGSFIFSVIDTKADLNKISQDKEKMLTTEYGRLLLVTSIGKENDTWYDTHMSVNGDDYRTPAPLKITKYNDDEKFIVNWRILSVNSDGKIDGYVPYSYFLVDENSNKGSIDTTASDSVTVKPSDEGLIAGYIGSFKIDWTVENYKTPDPTPDPAPELPKKDPNEIDKVQTEKKSDITVVKDIKITEDTLESKEDNLKIKANDDANRGVELTKKQAEEVLDVLKDDTNNKEALTVDLGNYRVKLDSKALDTIKDDAAADSFRIVADDMEKSKLNEKQLETVNEKQPVLIFEVYAESNGERIHDFKGGEANVSVSNDKFGNYSALHLFVEYVDPEGTTTRMQTRWKENRLEFKSPHLSEYIVVYDENSVNGYEEELQALIEVPSREEAPKPYSTKLVVTKHMSPDCSFKMALDTDGSSEVLFMSTDEKVVTVSETGVIKALKKGSATVVAMYGDYMVAVQVIVDEDNKKQKQTLSEDILKAENDGAVLTIMKKIKLGKSIKLNFFGAEGAQITYATSNDNVTVSKNGKITRKKNGKCYIDVTVFQNGVEHTYRIVAE